MLRASSKGMGTTAIVPLIVPVTEFGYKEAIGLGSDSLLELGRLPRIVGVGTALTRVHSSKVMRKERRCIVGR